MPQGKFFRIGYGIIMVFIIIYLADKVSFLFRPIEIMFRTLLLPMVISGFFYYLLRPVVDYLEKKSLQKPMAILLIYFVFGGIMTIIIAAVGPLLQTQIHNFVNNLPQLIEGFDTRIAKLQENRFVSHYFTNDRADLSQRVTDYLNNTITFTGNYIAGFLSWMTNTVIVVSTVPLVLYYLLKEGHKLPDYLLRMLPRKHRTEGGQILQEIDDAVSGFITSRFIICLLLGVMLYIGFILIGIQYALLLALISTVINLVPYIGPFIGAVPPLIVAFIDSPSMVVRVLIVVIAAQQIDGNLLSPHIFGRRLDVHPLTIILLLLVAGDMAGILGILLAIPVYLVIKILVQHINRLVFFRYE